MVSYLTVILAVSVPNVVAPAFALTGGGRNT